MSTPTHTQQLLAAIKEHGEGAVEEMRRQEGLNQQIVGFCKIDIKDVRICLSKALTLQTGRHG